MNKISIVSDALNTKELYQALKAEVPESPELQLTVEKTSNNTMALNLTILVATITGASALLGIIAKGLFAVWQKQIEAKAKTDVAKIEAASKMAIATVKIKTPDLEVELPSSLSDEEIQQKIALIKKASSVKAIKLITGK